MTANSARMATCDALVVGGGPAGLRAAEVISAAGFSVLLADRMPSVGRKFLVAGRGGLNLTHSEPREDFLKRYGGSAERWRALLAEFSPEDLRKWATGLGIETFVGTSRRVFPVGKHAAPLLRRWVERLRKQKVGFRLRHRLAALRFNGDEYEVEFESGGERVLLRARAVVLALGGASWPQTGSDGEWVGMLGDLGISISPLAAANVGYEVEWPVEFLTHAEGLPLKNVIVSAGGESVAGELLVTKYGLEGGALYQLGRVLRGMTQPEVVIDLKPAFTAERLAATLGSKGGDFLERATQAWRLGRAAEGLLRMRGPSGSVEELCRTAKEFRLSLRGPRPIAEAISAAGGVAWDALDENLMLKARPGIFCAGEMIDWEAPTGGYLLQGCFATGTRAARGVVSFLE
jgi:uncharacterized flavoprotein (TIGR03862 family)